MNTLPRLQPGDWRELLRIAVFERIGKNQLAAEKQAKIAALVREAESVIEQARRLA